MLPRYYLTLHRFNRSNGGMVDTRDLKSLGHCGCAGSSPASSTRPDSYSVNCPAAVFITAYRYGVYRLGVDIELLLYGEGRGGGVGAQGGSILALEGGYA